MHIVTVRWCDDKEWKIERGLFTSVDGLDDGLGRKSAPSNLESRLQCRRPIFLSAANSHTVETILE